MGNCTNKMGSRHSRIKVRVKSGRNFDTDAEQYRIFVEKFEDLEKEISEDEKKELTSKLNALKEGLGDRITKAKFFAQNAFEEIKGDHDLLKDVVTTIFQAIQIEECEDEKE